MKTSLTFNGVLLSVWMVARRLLEHYPHSENNSLRNRIDQRNLTKVILIGLMGFLHFHPYFRLRLGKG